MSADLFAERPHWQPLAARLRPTSLEDYVGQETLLGPGRALRRALDSGQLHSMILWGPAGVGKTTLAQLISRLCDAHFITISAVLAGVKDVRQAVDDARQQQQAGRRTVLFVDEVHRFNKAQQDAFLPFVEDGTLTLIGATTENPSFELNSALLSRARVYRLRPLGDAALATITERAFAAEAPELELPGGAVERLTAAADGDARRLLNLVELALDLCAEIEATALDESTLDEVLQGSVRRFDKHGDVFYEQISALHKAVRGSSPDGALYWLARMLDGGCDRRYVARRLVRMASEDIGNADPRALQLALNAWDVMERLGDAEGDLSLAQAAVYLASAPKSNAVYTAYKAVLDEVRSQPSHEVPMHLRNAPTKLMREGGYGQGYRYAHDEPEAYAAGENYLPEALAGSHWYEPVPRGLEAKIGDKLRHLRELDKNSKMRRYD